MRVQRLVAAVALTFLCGICLAQVPAESRRENLDRALTLAANAATAGEDARAKLDVWLSTLPVEQAGQLELDLVDSAVQGGYLSEQSSKFAREHLRIVERYMPANHPNRDPLQDYWSYRVMIEAKAERREIAAEEREYLLGRKHAELRRAMDLNERAATADRAAAQARIDAANEGARRRAAQAEAEARAFEADRAQMMLDLFRNSSFRTTPSVRCTRVGVTTVCN